MTFRRKNPWPPREILDLKLMHTWAFLCQLYTQNHWKTPPRSPLTEWKLPFSLYCDAKKLGEAFYPMRSHAPSIWQYDPVKDFHFYISAVNDFCILHSLKTTPTLWNMSFDEDVAILDIFSVNHYRFGYCRPYKYCQTYSCMDKWQKPKSYQMVMSKGRPFRF